MIDVRNMKYDGRQRNHQNGLTFYFTRHAQVLSFLIDVVGDKKRKVKVTMHPDINHDRPHIHINEHEASFAVDTGKLLVGECDNKTRKLIEDWIVRHREDLQQLWNIVKRGEAYRPLIKRIKSDKDFNEFGYKDREPQNKTVIDGVAIWYNDDILVERNDNGRVLVVGADDIFVVLPAAYDCHIDFESLDGDVHIRRIGE